jgi:hypothetical protein
METVPEIIQKLNGIPWRKAITITNEAEALVQEHIRRMRAVIDHLGKTEGFHPSDAYAKAQSAGYDAPEYPAFMDRLFRDVHFRGAGTREPLILTIAGHYFWSADRDLGQLENPWTPLMQLYEMGYTSSFDEDESLQSINILIGYQGGIQTYKLV